MMLRPLMGTLAFDGGLGAGGDDDVLAFELGEAVAVVDANVVRVDEVAGAVNDVHTVAPQLVSG